MQMRAPEFTAYIGPARTHPEIWRLLLGIGLILLIYLGGISLILVALYPVLGPLDYFGWVMQLAGPTTPWPTLVLLASFAGLFLGTIVAAPACHYRSPGSLFGPADETRRTFAVTLAVLVPIYAVALSATWALTRPVANMELAVWARFLPLALPLILLQTTAEELLFRGYLQQQLAARFRARAIWMGLPAVIFAALHWNPQAGANAWAIVGATFAFALIAADLTEKTGSLGAAMALHFLNNVNAMLLVSVKGTITGLALYVTPFGLDAAGSLLPGLALDVLVLVVIWRAIRLALGR